MRVKQSLKVRSAIIQNFETLFFKIVNKFITFKTNKKALIAICFDAVICFFGFFASSMITNARFDIASVTMVDQTAFMLVGTTLAVAWMLGVYKFKARDYEGLVVFKLGVTCASSSILVFIADGTLGSWPIQFGPYITFSTITFSLMVFFRFAVSHAFNLSNHSNTKRVLIYGAGSAGRQLVSYLAKEPQINILGVFDDNADLSGTFIGNYRVYSDIGITKTIEKLVPDQIFISIPSLTENKQRAIKNKLSVFDIPVFTVPSLKQILNYEKRLDQIRPVSISELLGREPIKPNKNLLSKSVESQNILVSGAGGSIGSEISRQLLKTGAKHIILLDNSEFALYSINQELENIKTVDKISCQITACLGSVTDSGLLDSVIRTNKVNSIFHCAAYKHVSLVENNVVQSLLNNVFGTQTLLGTAEKNNVEAFTLISSDKAVRPTNIMGATKRVSELICQSTAKQRKIKRISIVRFGNVLGSSGSVIPLFKKQIDEGGPITLTDTKITRYFMTINEAASLVIQASALGKAGEIFVLDMGKPILILDLAKKMIKLSGFRPILLENKKQALAKDEIGISVIGTKKGEKMYEELFTIGTPKRTAHPRIFISKENPLTLVKLEKLLSDLLDACQKNDQAGIKKILESTPVDYKP